MNCLDRYHQCGGLPYQKTVVAEPLEDGIVDDSAQDTYDTEQIRNVGKDYLSTAASTEVMGNLAKVGDAEVVGEVDYGRTSVSFAQNGLCSSQNLVDNLQLGQC